MSERVTLIERRVVDRELRDKIEGAIKDAYYHARDHGGTMHTAAVDATDAVLRLLR